MPLFNREATVGRAVESVLRQTLANFELVIVDDGSTDGSVNVVEAIGDPRVRLIRLPENRGGNAARNEGVRQSRAPIISFLDSDDEYLPHKLETVAATFAENSTLEGMIDSSQKLHSGTNRILRDRRNPALTDRDELLRALFDRRIWKATPGISATREAILRAGGFDETLKRRQDFDFLIRLIRAARFASVPTITWLKISSDDAISADLTGYMTSFMAFWDQHPDYYSNPDFRRGFAADLTRHCVSLVKRGHVRQLRTDIGLVADRIGVRGLGLSIALGIIELRKLKDERRRNPPDT